VSETVRVAIAFASRGIGGAERSMLRMAGQAQWRALECRIIVAARPNPAFRQAAGAAGVPYHELPAWDLRGWLRLMRRHRPQVLYVFGRFRTLPWAALARLAGVRCVVAAERTSAERRSDRLARKLDRYCVDAYVANSELGARNLRAAIGPAGPPVRVVPNGVDGPEVRPAETGPGEAPRLLCIANITDNKGQRVLLEAVRLLRPGRPELRATLVGRDFTAGRFFRDAEAAGLADTYTALGFVDDVPAQLAHATLVVLPTLRREGMPTALLEAMRAGVPVVASRVGGVSEIVEHERTGLLVAPGDPSQLACALDRLLGDAELRARLAAAARRHVLQHHGMASMVEGHRVAFQEALARTTRPAEGRGAAGLAPGPASVVHVTTAALSLRYLLLDQLLAIRRRGFAVAAVSSPGSDAASLETAGISHTAVTMTRRLTPLADLRSLVRLYRLMRRRGFTLVHTHNPKPGLLAQLAARLAGVPLIVNTLHGFYFHDHMHPWLRRFYVAVERIAARCSDLILFQNEEDMATAIREGIARPQQIRYLGNGIDVRRFDPGAVTEEVRRRTRASLGIEAHAPVVGFVGRLVAEKGLRELLQAVPLVRQRFPEARFLLVGGTDAEKADGLSPDVARALGVADACVFAGVRADMPELYRAMDVFALPSYREGFPRAPLEASAMKLPCVVTDVRGCRQAVGHGRNGLLVPVGDVGALAEAILALLADRGLARRLGEEGRRRALLEFDERRVFSTVLAEYERLLAAKGLSERIPA
jgi:glycosyltransferase involved in cell wall biosynthesis